MQLIFGEHGHHVLAVPAGKHRGEGFLDFRDHLASAQAVFVDEHGDDFVVGGVHVLSVEKNSFLNCIFSGG